MKRFIYISLLSVFVACSSIQVTSDYDREASFSTYKTYAFGEDAYKLGIDQLNQDRVLKAIENELAVKGFSQSDTPDMIIDVYIKGKQVVTANATTTGYPYRYRYGGGFTTTQVTYDEYIEGTMIILFVDKSKGKIFWQGAGTKAIDENASPQKREENINYVVQQILSNYPPKMN